MLRNARHVTERLCKNVKYLVSVSLCSLLVLSEHWCRWNPQRNAASGSWSRWTHRVLVLPLDVTQGRAYAGDVLQRLLQLHPHPGGQRGHGEARPSGPLLLLHQLTRANTHCSFTFCRLKHIPVITSLPPKREGEGGGRMKTAETMSHD